MADIVKQLIEDVVRSALGEILKKVGTRRGKRRARSATTGRFVRKKSTAPRKPAKKQVSRRKTVAARRKPTR